MNVQLLIVLLSAEEVTVEIAVLLLNKPDLFGFSLWNFSDLVLVMETKL
jgi:hypothetical protein